MKQIYLTFFLAFICLNSAQSQNYNHVYSKVIGVYQQPSWVSGQEYVIENFSNFSKCHTNISVNYTFDLEMGRNGVINMYAVNGGGENLVNTIVLGDSPVSGSITIPSGLLQIDQFLIKWQIGNTNSSNFIFENFTFTATSPLASMPTAPIVNNVYYSTAAAAIPLSATGSNLKWYTASTGGMPITTAPTPNTNTPGVTTYWVTQADAGGCESVRQPINVYVGVQATHLNFDGTNDYVAVTNPYTTFTNNITVEFWMNPTILIASGVGFGQGTPDVDNLSNNVWLVEGNASNNGTISFYVNDNGTWRTATTTTATTLNTWQHYTCVADNNGVRIYKDGVLNGNSPTGISSGIFSNSNAQLHIGKDARYPTGSGRNFNGSLEDVRIWNVARTVEQINGSKNCELQGNESGLVGYYKFNQGLDAQNNSTVTTLTDATANANHGTLTNFALSGTTSNWLAGSPVTTGVIVPSVATVTTPVIYNQGDTATALTATTGTNGTGLVWYTTATGGTGATTAPTPSTATAGSTSYWVSSTNANGCESERTEIEVTVNALATHLNFDGVDDRVELPDESNFDFMDTFSMEAWIRVTSFTQEWQTVISKGAEGPRIHRFGGSNFIAFGTGPANDLVSTVSVNDGNWHHIAATCNNGFKSLYVDGVLQGTQTVGTPLVTNNDNVRIGSQIDSYSPIRAFHGDIDEVRIWNRALPLAEIQNNMDCELPSPSTQNGLVAYYQFNQGFNGADNTSITTLTDASGNANNGTLTNFTKTGTTSNFLAGSPIVTGTNCAVLSTSNFEIANSIKMYPNPANSFVTVEINDLTNAKLQVLDITGKILMNQSLNASSNTINVQQLPSGIYFFKVVSNEGTSTNKIIKN